MPTEVNFDYKAHPKQKVVHEDPARFRVLVAGRRFGKTMTAIAEIAYYALTVKGSRLWYVAPTYRQSKSIAWALLNEFIPEKAIDGKNKQDLEIRLLNNSEISLKGAENEDRLRGVGLDGVVMDEYAFMKENVWGKIIRPMLVDSGGWALFIGTPAGFNHFWELAKRGDHEREIEGEVSELGVDIKPDDDWKTFRFTSYDNPYIPQNEILSAKETTNRDYFAQEYLAKFTKFTGLVYKEFSRDTHIVEPFDIPPEWMRGVSVDIGYTNPSVALFFAVNTEGQIYVFDEIYTKGMTTADFLERIKERTESRYYQVRVADPSAADFIARAREEGMWFTAPERPKGSRVKGWVNETINWVRDYLKVKKSNNEPDLFFFPNCKGTIREFQLYAWDEQKPDDKEVTRTPIKKDDHAMDALRYAVVEMRGRKADPRAPHIQRGNLPVKDLSKKNWAIGT